MHTAMQILGITVLVSVIAYDFTKQSIFKEVRAFLIAQVKRTNNEVIVTKVEGLVTCHYCFSHWATFAVMAWAGWPHFSLFGNQLLNVIVSVAIVITVAQPIMIGLDWGIDLMSCFWVVLDSSAKTQLKERLAQMVEKHGEKHVTERLADGVYLDTIESEN